MSSPWRPVAACGGLLLVLAVGLPLLLRPKNETREEEPLKPVVTVADIATVHPLVQKPAKTLAGKLLLASQTAGVSSVDGTVARILVEPGTRVKRGEVVAEISIGAPVRMPAAVENKQNKAEAAQEKAVDKQSEVGRKIARARVRLAEAQVRVDAAQARVAEMRQMIKRLQAGERIPLGESSASDKEHVAPASEPDSPGAKTAARPVREAQARMQRDLAAAQKAAEDANRRLSAAESSAAKATSQLKTAEAKVEKVEEQFEKQLVSGAEVEDARSAAREAQHLATEAIDKAFAARQEANKAQARVEMLKNNQETANGRKDASAVAEPTARPTREPASNTEYLTLAQASKMAKEALEESAAASRAAEEIHREIEAAERQVHSSSSEVVATTERLAAAQQEVMDSAPRPEFVEVVAPVDGIITWTAPLAREVKKGHKVFGMAQNQTLTCGFHVPQALAASIPRSGVLPGVLTGRMAPATPSLAPQLPPATSGKLLPVVTATVQYISGPDEQGMVDVSGPLAIITPGDPPIQAKAGLEVIVSFRPVDPAEQVSLPAPAVTQRDGKHWVATVQDGTAPETQNQVVWRAVTVAGTSSQRVLVRGLVPGTRYLPDAKAVSALTPPGSEGTPFIVPPAPVTAGTPGQLDSSKQTGAS